MSNDAITLTLEPRKIVGKAVKHLRREGWVPAVVHDHGKESLIAQANLHDILRVYQQAGKHHVVTVTYGGKNYNTIIRDAEFEPRKHTLSHVVFNAVAANQHVEAEVPIHPKYDEGNESTPAERAGLLVIHNLESIEVKALPADLPDVLYFDAEKLVNVGDHVTVADLRLPKGVTVELDPGQAIATVYEPSAVAAANDAAGGDADDDASSVESDNESGATEGTQADEIRPGGKEQKESKDQGRNPEKQ